MSISEFIKECQENVLSGVGISSDDATKLFDIPDENIPELAKAANQITREFNGPKVDVEQLNNIKKNACSEDCSFCGQSAFFDTGIESYQLPTSDEVVERAQ
ncbi:MAG: biotin synthase BioB, partial [Nitrosopumilaceae archaeon]|nr:biotin synthase BioB [Nitrosopumilaceae archaeon]